MPEPPKRPPVAREPRSVVLVVHNAAGRLESIVSAWVQHLEKVRIDYEVIVVDDGSSDGTEIEADLLLGRFAALQVVHHGVRRGEGAALRSGLARARHPLFFYTLAHQAYGPGQFDELVKAIDEADLVTTHRVGRPLPAWLALWDLFFGLFLRVVFGLPLEKRTTWLGWSGLGRRLVSRWMFGVRVRDPECPYRLFRRDIFRHIPIEADGPFAHVEILAKANFLGCWMRDVPLAVGAQAPADSVEGFYADAWQLFRDPHFGPVNLGESAPAAVPEVPAPNL